MKKLLFVGILCFLFGLTWDISYRNPYYEARGALRIEQKLLGVVYVYTWAAPGFCEKYPSEWYIGKPEELPSLW